MENTFTKTIGNNTVLFNVAISWVKVSSPVAGYNGGKPQYELQISTADLDQAYAWQSIMSNLSIKEQGETTFTLKRPAFRGRPNVVHSSGVLFTEQERKEIGNMSIADVKLSSNVHPTSGTKYVSLEAIKVTQLIPYVPQEVQLDDFDF